MNVIIANKQQNQLSNLDVDIIKNISGQYDVNEVVEMFRNFFYSKMILDVTALKNYTDFITYEKLIHGLEADKIIFLLPEGTNLCTSYFLGQLISIGIYNFTTNINGVLYLLKKANTFKDVEHILKMANIQSAEDTGAAAIENTPVKPSSTGHTIIGVSNVTHSAGASTLIYMLAKELSVVYGKENVIAIEVDKTDFSYFNDKGMISAKSNDLKNVLDKFSNCSMILVDLNDVKDTSFCDEVIYLIEPSTIKLNKLVRNRRDIFTKISGKKIVLNQSLLLNNDVFDFEREAGIKVFYNLPPLDERKRNAIIGDFLSKLGLMNNSSPKNGSTKIFGLFRR